MSNSAVKSKDEWFAAYRLTRSQFRCGHELNASTAYVTSQMSRHGRLSWRARCAVCRAAALVVHPLRSGPAPKPLIERFMSKVRVTAKCWLWLGHGDSRGYGLINVGSTTENSKTMVRAARLSYELFVGPIPDGSFILHSCDYPPCVAPHHLRPGTHTENMADMRARGRASCGLRGEQHHSAKLIDQDVVDLRHAFRSGVSQAELARYYGLVAVSRIVHEKTWRSVANGEPSPEIEQWLHNRSTR